MSSGMLERMRRVCRVRPVCRVTIHRWVRRFTPILVEAAHCARHAIRSRWQVHPKVVGGWWYVYRAVDEYGHVIDVCVLPQWGRRAARGRRCIRLCARSRSAPRAHRAAGARHEDPTVDVSRLTPAGRHEIKVNARRWADLRDSLTGVTLRNAGGHLAIPSTSRRGWATPSRRHGATLPA